MRGILGGESGAAAHLRASAILEVLLPAKARDLRGDLGTPRNSTTHQPHLAFRKYLNAGDLALARQVFDEIPRPDVRSWTVLISAYIKGGDCREAINLYTLVRNSGRVEPDELAILAVARACAAIGDTARAKEIHSDALYYGLSSQLVLGNALIDMYGKCKCIEGAERVFHDLPLKDLITWTSFCSCYVNCGLSREALEAFHEMGLSGIKPNAVTLSSVLPACSALKWLKQGIEIHAFSVRNAMQENVFVNSALVDMYSCCSCIKHAELVFYSTKQTDVVSWNVMISAYFSNGEWEKGLDMIQNMRKFGVKMDVASWNTLISGYVENGKFQEALGVVGDMQQLGFKPNRVTIASMLTACAHLEDWRGGKEIHGHMIRHHDMMDLESNTSLVLIYAKSGDLETSTTVFSMMPVKDTIAWNTIIIANGIHGRGKEALSLFHTMVASGVKPNAVTFTSILSSCSHSKMVDEGLLVFHSMSRDHAVKPDANHYSCVVDVLSRGGRLEEAYKFIREMPMEPKAEAWGALLGACKKYKNVDLARIAANRLFQIEPHNSANYVLLFNILITAKLWEEASEARKMMRDRGIMKIPGFSWVWVKNKLYTFVVGDHKNDSINDIHKFLDEIRENLMRQIGHLQGSEQDNLCSHSEKLAVSFAVLKTKSEPPVVIRVFKNLRICDDCHETIKFIASYTGIRIIVRDSLRFHHFEGGSCSCRDFW